LHKKKLKCGEAEIHGVIERLRKNQGLDDADAKSQIQPVLVAALSKFIRVWTLDEFLREKDKIFEAPPDVWIHADCCYPHPSRQCPKQYFREHPKVYGGCTRPIIDVGRRGKISGKTSPTGSLHNTTRFARNQP